MISTIFDDIRIAVGIIADLCAIALFVWLVLVIVTLTGGG